MVDSGSGEKHEQYVEEVLWDDRAQFALALFIFSFLPLRSPLALQSLAKITQKALPEDRGNDASSQTKCQATTPLSLFSSSSSLCQLGLPGLQIHFGLQRLQLLLTRLQKALSEEKVPRCMESSQLAPEATFPG